MVVSLIDPRVDRASMTNRALGPACVVLSRRIGALNIRLDATNGLFFNDGQENTIGLMETAMDQYRQWRFSRNCAYIV